jgi:hypothetical protein
MAAALVSVWPSQDADAQLRAGTYSCATVTINASGQIAAITVDKCASRTVWLHSGGEILIHSRGKLGCHSC